MIKESYKQIISPGKFGCGVQVATFVAFEIKKERMNEWMIEWKKERKKER